MMMARTQEVEEVEKWETIIDYTTTEDLIRVILMLMIMAIVFT